MEGDDGISSDEIADEELKAITEELDQYEQWLGNFRIVGSGMSGNPTDGFGYTQPE